MKIDVFCGWGDGPDVGINLERTEDEARCYQRPDKHWFIDLTAAEARELAAKLIACAEQAEHHYREYGKWLEEANADAG